MDNPHKFSNFLNNLLLRDVINKYIKFLLIQPKYPKAKKSMNRHNWTNEVKNKKYNIVRSAIA